MFRVSVRLVFHENVVERFSETIIDLIFGPVSGNVRINLQMFTFTLQAKQHFNAQAIHPTCRATIPGPTPAADIWSHTVYIRCDHVWFHSIAIDFLRGIRVIDGIDQMEEFRRALVLIELSKRPDGPQ